MWRNGEEITIEDYCKPREKISEKERRYYLEEVDCLCPKCGKPLINPVDGSILSLCEIAHIFPNRPKDMESIILADVEVEGDNSESMENKIALCLNCHTIYDDHKTEAKYKEMLELKRKKAAELKAKHILAKANLEEDLGNAIVALVKLDAKELKNAGKLKYKSLMVKQKVEDQLLCSSIENQVTRYFPLINTRFKMLDSTGLRHEIVCKSVNLEYKKLTQLNLTQDQIFEKITDWFESKTCVSRPACEIMTSYFVQKCDIYDEISK